MHRRANGAWFVGNGTINVIEIKKPYSIPNEILLTSCSLSQLHWPRVCMVRIIQWQQQQQQQQQLHRLTSPVYTYVRVHTSVKRKSNVGHRSVHRFITLSAERTDGRGCCRKARVKIELLLVLLLLLLKQELNFISGKTNFCRQRDVGPTSLSGDATATYGTIDPFVVLSSAVLARNCSHTLWAWKNSNLSYSIFLLKKDSIRLFMSKDVQTKGTYLKTRVAFGRFGSFLPSSSVPC